MSAGSPVTDPQRSDSADYEVVESRPVFDGKVLSLRLDQLRMSDGTVAEREIVSHPGAVGVLALDEGDNVVMVNQYRHPVRRRLDELPAGLLDVDHETALECWQREIAEEAGLQADRWDVLVDLLTSPGMSDEAIRIFLARGLRPLTDRGDFAAEHEELTLTVHRVPLAEAVAGARAGRLTNAACVAGVLAAAAAQADGWRQLRPVDAPWSARPER